jgi:hypothetical protein
MPSWAETRLACQGILKLARFDRDFVRFFDQSPAGALRSFWVVGAAYLYSMLDLWVGFPPEIANGARYTLAISVAFAVNSAILPVALLALAPVLQREAEAVGAITIYNWSNLLWIAIGIPVQILEWAGMALETLQLVWLVYLAIAGLFEGFLLRHALRVGWPVAIGFAFADIVICQFFIYPLLGQAGAQ